MGIKKYFYIVVAVLAIIILTSFFSFPLNHKLALIGGFSTPFGGRILAEIPCVCEAATLLFVGPPVGGSFMLSNSSQIYEYYAPFQPNWVLGLAEGFETCTEPDPFTGCLGGLPVGGGPEIKIMGTSR